MDSLQSHRDYLEGEWQSLRSSPLSMRRARLVAALVDAYVDRLFASAPGVDDILAFRAGMAAGSPALGLIMALCGDKGVHLTIEAVEIPIADYGGLPVEEFMVSLYNGHTVQRLRLVLPDGERREMLDVLREAIGALD